MARPYKPKTPNEQVASIAFKQRTIDDNVAQFLTMLRDCRSGTSAPKVGLAQGQLDMVMLA